MAKNVADMTSDELRKMIAEVVEEKLHALLTDPDAGLTLRDDVRLRLLQQRKEVATGERGEDLEDIARELGLG